MDTNVSFFFMGTRPTDGREFDVECTDDTLMSALDASPLGVVLDLDLHALCHGRV